MGGSKAGYEKYKQKMIEKLGSEEAFIEFLKQIRSKGGKKSTNRPFRDIPGLAKEAARKSHEKENV